MEKENKHRKNSFIWNIPESEFIKIINENKSFILIGAALGFKHKPGSNSRKEIRKRAESLGIAIKEKTITQVNKNIPPQSLKRKASINRFCSSCGSKIVKDNKSGLCYKCKREKYERDVINDFKENGGTDGWIMHGAPKIIRNYIFEKQNKQCAICNMDSTWNGKELHFILDHIDGNAANNVEANLRLICPNCDSQLDTFKSRNKNSARRNKCHN